MKNENNNPRKSNIIGICVSQLQNHEVSGLTHTIYQCARANGYQVMVFGCFAKMDFPTPHSNGEASIFENIPMKRSEGTDPHGADDSAQGAVTETAR